MSLFEKLKNKRLSLQEKRKQRDNSYLFDDGDNSTKKKKYTPPSKAESDAIQSRSANRDAKKYASGEYPKIGGGDRMTPKSKGSGASTGGTKIPSATVGGKSKGTTPVKVNITKPIKQSEVSKKAKEFTQNLKKIKGTKTGKPISTGDIGFTAPDRKTKVAKRTTRAIKQGTPDPFKSKTKFSQKGFEKSLKKFSKGPRTGIDNPFMKSPAGDRFNIGDTKGQMNVKAMNRKSFKKTQPKDVKLPKSFTDFSKKLKTLKTDVAKTASATPRTVTKKYKPTTTVKQSEVSKQAKDFTKKVNQARTKDASTNVFKRVTAATSGKKVTNSKGIGNEFRGAENKAARNAEIIKRGGSVTDNVTTNRTRGPYKKKMVTRTVGKKSISDIMKQNTIKGAKGPTSMKDVKLPQFTKTDSPSFKLSPRGQKVAAKIPKAFRGKTFAKIGKAALKSPVVAAVAGGGLAAATGYGAYKAYKALKKDKTKLKYKDFKSLSTPSDPDKGKVIDRETGKPARFSSTRKIPKSSSAEFKSKYYYK